jgi:hypothetical protein
MRKLTDTEWYEEGTSVATAISLEYYNVMSSFSFSTFTVQNIDHYCPKTTGQYFDQTVKIYSLRNTSIGQHFVRLMVISGKYSDRITSMEPSPVPEYSLEKRKFSQVLMMQHRTLGCLHQNQTLLFV